MPQQLMNPRGIFRCVENHIAQRIDELSQKVLGLVDNSKVNADLFLDYLRGHIAKKYNIQETVKIRKPMGPAIPAPFTQAFFDKCDFVINAFGD
jgi:hypothetical protein